MVWLRSVMPDDAEAYANVGSSIHPDERTDPAVLRARWQQESRHPTRQARYLIVDKDAVCGLAFWSCPERWEAGLPQVANVNVRMTPSNQFDDAFGWILRRMERGASSAGAALARAVTREDEPFHRAMLKRQGYAIDRTFRSWRLDLAKHGAALLQARKQSRRLMDDGGIRLAAASDRLDDVWRRLYDLSILTIPDIPASFLKPVPSFETWLLTMQGPDMYPDRIWTAWADDQLVGYSYLKYPQAGDVWTGYTATRKADRLRGVARAVKLETIGQAAELGIASIRTTNDIENTAILHINEVLGYDQFPGLVTYLKPLE